MPSQKQQTAETETRRAPETITINPAYAEAFRYLLFAQEFDPTGRYARFIQNLALKNIPFQYTNPRFLDELLTFSKEFKTFLQDSKVSETKIESSVPQVMVTSVARELTAMPATISGVKRKRIEEITDVYVKQLRKVVGRVGGEDAFKRNLTEEITRLTQESRDETEFGRKVEDLLTNKAAAVSTDPTAIREVARPVAHSVVQAAGAMLPAIMAPAAEEAAITKGLVESPVKRKDLWIRVYTQKAGRDAEPNLDDVNRLTATAEAFLAVTHGPDLTSPTIFFRTGAKGLQKPLAALADVALTVFPRETRDAVIESILRRGWEASTAADKLNKKFGEIVVDSGIFQAAIAKGNEAYGTREPRSFKGVTNAMSDVATSIFGTPRSTEDILALVELGIIKEDYITGWLPNYMAGAHAHQSGLFDVLFQFGANWGIQKAAAGLAGKAAGGGLGKLLGGALGSLGGPITAALGAILGSELFNRIFSLFGRRGAGPPKKWYKDWSPTGLLFPLVLVVGPILLIATTSIYIDPIMFGSAFQQPNLGPVVDCRTDSNNPLCQFTPCTGKDCAWPAQGAIIQGPFATCDGTTHRLVDAIDILGHYLEPVYSVTGGTIEDVGTGCPDNPTHPGCGSNYGNYVDIKTPDGHILRYAHLSELFIDQMAAKVHQQINPGDPVGKMDSSGTVSEHVHFEVLGQPIGQSSVAKYLPVDQNFARQLYQCINSAGCNQCPQM